MTSEVLSWAQKLVKTQTLVKVDPPKNFTTSFANGNVFVAILAHVSEVALKINTTSETELDILSRINAAFDEFLEIGVPRLLDAEDLRISPYPDKQSVATYCIEIRRLDVFYCVCCYLFSTAIFCYKKFYFCSLLFC
jgi:hypothetical protein